MKKIGFALAVMLGFGCGGDKMDGFIGDLEGYKSKMCACKDKDCTEKVFEEYKKWENEKLEPAMKGTKKEDVDKGKMTKFMAAKDGMKECRRKYRDGDTGGAPPAGDPGAAPTP